MCFLVSFAAPSIRKAPLKFEDEIWDTIIPCHWEDTQGMLCPEHNDQVIIFPTSKQMEEMGKAGYPPPNGFRERAKRETSEGNFLMMPYAPNVPYIQEVNNHTLGQAHHAFKRELSPESASTEVCKNFFGCPKTEPGKGKDSVDFKASLNSALYKQFGPEAYKEINPVMETMIMSFNQSGFNMGGKYKYYIANREEFEPEKGRAIKTVEQQLKRMRDGENGTKELKVEDIVSELNMCYFTDEAKSANSEFKFQKGSGVGFSYFQVMCWGRGDKLLISLIFFHDSISFAKIEQTIYKLEKHRMCKDVLHERYSSSYRRTWYGKVEKSESRTPFYKNVCRDMFQLKEELKYKDRTLTGKMKEGIRKITWNHMLKEIQEKYIKMLK
jgi:hypothetical protein